MILDHRLPLGARRSRASHAGVKIHILMVVTLLLAGCVVGSGEMKACADACEKGGGRMLSVSAGVPAECRCQAVTPDGGAP